MNEKKDEKNFLQTLKMHLEPLTKQIKYFYTHHKRPFLAVVGSSVILSIYAMSLSSENEVHVFHKENKVELEGGQIIGTSKHISERKDLINSGKLKSIESDLKQVSSDLKDLKDKIDEFKTKPSEQKEMQSNNGNTSTTLQAEPADPSLAPQAIRRKTIDPRVESISMGGSFSRAKKVSAGPQIVSFPTKLGEEETPGVMIPSGGYVKARMLTGVQSPEGRPLPVLLQTDFAFIGPNQTRIDLLGCFLIAKSTGNLSIERVEMQATKMSCVSNSGKMFEREINAFVVDNEDQSFAVKGVLDSKQDRVASKAFLASMVEGMGKAAMQKQTSSTRDKFGNTNENVSGDDAKYMAAGAAAHTGSLVTQWFLKQAQNLLPTIIVTSGQEVWVVLQDKVSLPTWYFKKGKSEENQFSYLSGLIN